MSVTFVDANGTGNIAGVSASSLAVPLPAGAAAGDFCLIGIASSINTLLVKPAGWNDAPAPPALGNGASSTQGSVNSSSGWAWFWKFLVSGDLGTSPNFTGGSAQRRSGISVAFRGVNTTTPFDPVTPSDVGNNTSLSSRPLPTATTTATRTLVGAVSDRNSTSGFTKPAAYTLAADAYTTGSGGAGGAVAYRESVAAGSVGGDTFSRNAGPATGAITSLLVLNPAAATVDSGDFFEVL